MAPGESNSHVSNDVKWSRDGKRRDPETSHEPNRSRSWHQYVGALYLKYDWRSVLSYDFMWQTSRLSRCIRIEISYECYRWHWTDSVFLLLLYYSASIDNQATTPFGYRSSMVFRCVHWQYPNARRKRCQDLNSFPWENWRRPPGCPRTMWMKTIQQDLKYDNLSLNEATDMAQNRPLCGDWCARLVLRTANGACQKRRRRRRRRRDKNDHTNTRCTTQR